MVAFAYSEMPMQQWPILPLETDAELDDVITQARRSYEAFAAGH